MTDKSRVHGKAAAGSALDLVRRYFPGASDEEAEAILWNRTGWPAFWHITPRNPTPISALRKQLREFRDALARLRPGQSLCDFCDRKAMPADTLCRKCDWILNEVRGD